MTTSVKAICTGKELTRGLHRKIRKNVPGKSSTFLEWKMIFVEIYSFIQNTHEWVRESVQESHFPSELTSQMPHQPTPGQAGCLPHETQGLKRWAHHWLPPQTHEQEARLEAKQLRLETGLCVIQPFTGHRTKPLEKGLLIFHRQTDTVPIRQFTFKRWQSQE